MKFNRSRHDRVHPRERFTWLFDWSIVTIIDNTMPPRDPNDDDDDDPEDEDDDAESDDDFEPAVVREPDE
jgi:hypothetical protein